MYSPILPLFMNTSSTVLPLLIHTQCPVLLLFNYTNSPVLPLFINSVHTQFPVLPLFIHTHSPMHWPVLSLTVCVTVIGTPAGPTSLCGCNTKHSHCIC